MKYIVIFVSLFVFYQTSNGEELVEQAGACTFGFSSSNICKDGLYDVALYGKSVDINEREMLNLRVRHGGISHDLDISPDTVMLEGDVGVISFEDINFDGYPDVAISTSFGLPNLYLDYWVYLPEKNIFVKVGNYSKFTIDVENRVLTNTQKESAAEYGCNTFYWLAYELIKLNV
ncbi:MAG: hypothetical protein COB04_14380 [Gammaproteobacteria bacterium]|nr:MAG: hypothetical protein COB04_14380 [Gammaproteobacteria bacterium]